MGAPTDVVGDEKRARRPMWLATRDGFGDGVFDAGSRGSVGSARGSAVTRINVSIASTQKDLMAEAPSIYGRT